MDVQSLEGARERTANIDPTNCQYLDQHTHVPVVKLALVWSLEGIKFKHGHTHKCTGSMCVPVVRFALVYGMYMQRSWLKEVDPTASAKYTISPLIPSGGEVPPLGISGGIFHTDPDHSFPCYQLNF